MCSEKQKGNSKLQEIASNRPLLLHAGFFGVTCVFPISYEHFTHVGMLQSRYRQCKTEWLLSTWSDYVRYFAWSLFVVKTSYVITEKANVKNNINEKKACQISETAFAIA